MVQRWFLLHLSVGCHIFSSFFWLLLLNAYSFSRLFLFTYILASLTVRKTRRTESIFLWESKQDFFLAHKCWRKEFFCAEKLSGSDIFRSSCATIFFSWWHVYEYWGVKEFSVLLSQSWNNLSWLRLTTKGVIRSLVTSACLYEHLRSFFCKFNHLRTRYSEKKVRKTRKRRSLATVNAEIV